MRKATVWRKVHCNGSVRITSSHTWKWVQCVHGYGADEGKLYLPLHTDRRFFLLCTFAQSHKKQQLCYCPTVVPGSQIQPRFKVPSKARYGNDTGRSVNGSGWPQHSHPPTLAPSWSLATRKSEGQRCFSTELGSSTTRKGVEASKVTRISIPCRFSSVSSSINGDTESSWVSSLLFFRYQKMQI